MSAIESVSSNSLNNSQFIPMAKTERGWDAYQRLHKNDQPSDRPVKAGGEHNTPQPRPVIDDTPGFRPVASGGEHNTPQIRPLTDNTPGYRPIANGGEHNTPQIRPLTDGTPDFRPIKNDGEHNTPQTRPLTDGTPGYRPIKVEGEYNLRPLPQTAEATGFIPVKPGQYGLSGNDDSLVSRKDLFTGTELNPSVAQGKSVEAKELRAGEAAQKLVASTLVEPILKQLRETNNAAAPFGPSEAEKQFGPILDGQIADRIVGAADFPLVDRIKQDLMKNSAYTAQATQASATSYDTAKTKPLDILG